MFVHTVCRIKNIKRIVAQHVPAKKSCTFCEKVMAIVIYDTKDVLLVDYNGVTINAEILRD